MSFVRRLVKRDSGAAIVENLVATTLLGISLVYLLGSYSTFAISSRTAEQVALGQTFNRAQAARIQAAPYRDDGDYSAYYNTVPTGMTRTVTVLWINVGGMAFAAAPNTLGLEMVTLALDWNGSTISTIQFVKGNR